MTLIRKKQFELRPWQLEDIPSLTKYANDKYIWNNVRDSFPHPYTEEDAESYINMNLSLPYVQNLAIVIDGEAAGGIGIIPQTDVQRFSAEIGYWLGEPFRRKGLMPEIIKTAVEYFFSNTTFVNLYALVYNYNIASIRSLEKAGFRKVGIMKNTIFKNGQFMNCYYYETVKETLP